MLIKAHFSLFRSEFSLLKRILPLKFLACNLSLAQHNLRTTLHKFSPTKITLRCKKRLSLKRESCWIPKNDFPPIILKDAKIVTLLIKQTFLLEKSKDRIHNQNQTAVLGNSIPVLGVKPKRGRYVFGLFFEIGRSSVISFKKFRRELSIDAAEHKSTSKNKGVVRILIIFLDRPMFSHVIRKVSARASHWCGWT